MDGREPDRDKDRVRTLVGEYVVRAIVELVRRDAQICADMRVKLVGSERHSTSRAQRPDQGSQYYDAVHKYYVAP